MSFFALTLQQRGSVEYSQQQEMIDGIICQITEIFLVTFYCSVKVRQKWYLIFFKNHDARYMRLSLRWYDDTTATGTATSRQQGYNNDMRMICNNVDTSKCEICDKIKNHFEFFYYGIICVRISIRFINVWEKNQIIHLILHQNFQLRKMLDDYVVFVDQVQINLNVVIVT